MFAFVDHNCDLTYDTGEPYGWANDAKPFDPGAKEMAGLQVVLRGDDVDQPPLESIQRGMSFADISRMQGVNIGVVTHLDDALFSAEQAAKGLWEPYAFLEDGGTVTLASPLRVEVQDQAADIFGINKSHVEILSSREILAKQAEILESASRR